MTHLPDPVSAPVAIGGLGGSGTRVFAALLRHAGLYIGDTLNPPLDNLWFTVLFKRRAWTEQTPPQAELAEAARLFTRAMTTGLADRLDRDARARIEALRADLPPLGTWRCGAQAETIDSLLASRPAPARRWGWKEPNTHVFLPALDAAIPGLRYIHVLRDGLDMAFSNNTWQMRHWEHLYGLADDPALPRPQRQLRYWIAANHAAITYGRAHMPGRFLAIRYEDFCADPAGHWPRLRALIDAPEGLALPADLVQPTSIGRSEDHDLSLFPPAMLAEARALQLDLDALSNAG